MHPRPYQLVDSTIGLMFTQRYVSRKNQRTIWKLHVVTGSYIKDFVVNRPLIKSTKKIINEQAKHWQQVFKRLVAIVQFLA